MTRFLTTVFAVLFLALPLRAQEQDIQTVIGDQITAFGSDDFDTAFTFASPGIRQMFQTPERFGEMVRNGYPMVHRPQAYVFEDLQQTGEGTFQYLLIEGPDGNYYRAEYDMIQTGDGWKIRGVRISRAEGIGA